MQPIEAFRDAHERALRLLRLHDGLVNTRQRSIRSDWKSNFCRLMHWPQTSEIDRVDSNDAVLILRDGADIKRDDFSAESLDDLLRSAITFGVSAIDRYVHERVVKGFVTAFRSPELTKQQRDFQVPATLAIDIVNRIHAARRSSKNTRPANEIRKAVQEVLHKRPFQSWREIEYGFCLIGYKNLGKELKTANGITDADMKSIEQSLNKIVSRRNKIVHEGDLARHQRGGNVSPQSIKRKWVSDSLYFFSDFAEKLEAV